MRNFVRKYVGDEGRTSTSEVEMEVVAGEVAIKVSEPQKKGGVKFEKKEEKVDSDDESDDTPRKPTKKAESSGGGMVCACICVCACVGAKGGTFSSECPYAFVLYAPVCIILTPCQQLRLAPLCT